MINALTGDTTPRSFPLRPREDGTVGIDTDNNQVIDDSDCYLTLETPQGSERLDFGDLRAALANLGADRQPVDDGAVVGELKKQYADDSLEGLGIVNGSFNFDFLSTYRHTQSFSLSGDGITYTLQFDPEAPLKEYSGEGVALVQDEDGVLHWEFPSAPEPPPAPEGAVTEATLVERDGVLHWLFPGEVPEPGDRIVGNADTAAENLLQG